MPSLFVIRGSDQGHCFELRESSTALGRDASNPIQLHDTEVSRRHAEFRLGTDGCMLVDLQSSNGTYVNGSRVESHPLTSGDQVQVGRTLLLFTGAAPGEAERSRVNVVVGGAGGSSNGSRIVHTISQEEGSRALAPEGDSQDSPWLARARSNLQIMYRTALTVSHTLDIDQLLSRILEMIFEWVDCDRGCILLFDGETKKLVPRARRTRQSTKSDQTMTISQTILDYVLERDEGVLTSDAQDDSRWNPAASILQLGIREAICVPLRGRYDSVGVIYIDTSMSPQDVIRQGGAVEKFSEEHLKLMIAIAHQAALAVEDTQYYSAMVQAERLAAVGQTIATLSHHIKNILQGIRGGSYLIEHGLSDHDEEVVRKGWDIVEKNQNKISTLVLDMLTFSKERDPDLAPADINQVVGDVIELMNARAAELDVDLQWSPADEMPTLTFDPDGMHRAVLNIVTNALDAAGDMIDKRGRVSVRTEHDSENKLLQVIVEDNGPGIAPEDREVIFTLFVSRKGGRGTGLGLPVSQKIVREHGGRILVESEEGRGSTFTLELPAIPPNSVSTTQAT